MSDFLFANPVKNDHVDSRKKYMDLFNLSQDEVDRIELVTNTLASDLMATNSVTITENDANSWSVHIVPSMYTMACELHTVIKRYVDGGATINPDKCLIKFTLMKKEYVQCMVQWLHDYHVNIVEFSYPIDGFINSK